jgi:hypothetical protein
MDLKGIERIENGNMTYTDELIKKAKKAFNVTIPKTVPFNKIDDTADFIIKSIIKPMLAK